VCTRAAESRPEQLWREDKIDELLAARAKADAEIGTCAPVVEVADRLVRIARDRS
jgi:hypothetical protein